MTTRPTTHAILAAVVAAAIVGAACSSQTPAKPVHTDGSPAPAATAETTKAPQVATIGGTDGFTFPDGLRVVVVSATRYTIGRAAAGAKPGQVGVVITVAITNNTAHPVDLALTTVHLAYGASGIQAAPVFDTENNLGTGFEGKVAPGRSATARYGFAADPAGLGQVDVEVAPAFLDYDSVLFTGTVA